MLYLELHSNTAFLIVYLKINKFIDNWTSDQGAGLRITTNYNLKDNAGHMFRLKSIRIAVILVERIVLKWKLSFPRANETNTIDAKPAKLNYSLRNIQS